MGGGGGGGGGGGMGAGGAKRPVDLRLTGNGYEMVSKY